MPCFEPTTRTRLHRCAHKANYDQAVIYQILDEIPECTIAVCDGDQPRQMVSTQWRVGDALYIHGGISSSFYKLLARGAPVSVSVAATDGMVLARSAYDTSINFRSVLIYGQFEVVSDLSEQLALLEAFYEHLLPGRWREIRQPSVSEMASTYVLRLPLTEVSAKLSRGEPDDQETEGSPTWGGVRPYLHAWGPIEPDSASRELPLPVSVAQL